MLVKIIEKGSLWNPLLFFFCVLRLFVKFWCDWHGGFFYFFHCLQHTSHHLCPSSKGSQDLTEVVIIYVDFLLDISLESQDFKEIVIIYVGFLLVISLENVLRRCLSCFTFNTKLVVDSPDVLKDLTICFFVK